MSVNYVSLDRAFRLIADLPLDLHSAGDAACAPGPGAAVSASTAAGPRRAHPHHRPGDRAGPEAAAGQSDAATHSGRHVRGAGSNPARSRRFQGWGCALREVWDQWERYEMGLSVRCAYYLKDLHCRIKCNDISSYGLQRCLTLCRYLIK